MAARIAESMTRDSSIFSAPEISVYLSGSTPVEVCCIISSFPSLESCMAHAIMTSVPGYIKKYQKVEFEKYVKNFISLLF